MVLKKRLLLLLLFILFCFIRETQCLAGGSLYGFIAGLVVGPLALLTFLLVVILCCCNTTKRKLERRYNMGDKISMSEAEF
jgi:hypothetical protein